MQTGIFIYHSCIPSPQNGHSSYLLNDRASELMSEPYWPHRKSDRLRPPPPRHRLPELLCSADRPSRAQPAGHLGQGAKGQPHRTPRPRPPSSATERPQSRPLGAGESPSSPAVPSDIPGPRGHELEENGSRSAGPNPGRFLTAAGAWGVGGVGGRCRQPSTGGLGLRRELRV